MLGLMYREVRGLHQAAYVLAVFAFISQLLALVRDRLLAHKFGAGEMLDIYYSAFRIPDILFVLFASTLSVYVLIPFVSKAAADDTGEAKRLLSSVVTAFVVSYSAIAFLLFLTAPLYVPIMFPGIEDSATLTTVLRILLLQPLFLGLSNVLGVVTQLSHRFILYAVSPVLYNFGIIIGVVFFYPYWGLAGLAWGVVLGAVAHAAIQWPLLRSSTIFGSFFRGFCFARIKPVLAVSLPRALTLSANQLVLLVLFGIASAFTAGSVAVFQFAYNLQSVPLAVIGVSYSVAAFPTLAQLFASQNMEQFRSQIMTALRHIIFWSVPIIALCVVLRAQLVRVILGSGSFDWEDTRLTAAVFAVLIVALLAHGINLLLVRALYAGGNTRVPLIVNGVSALLTIGFMWVTAAWYSAATPFAQSVASWLRVSDVAGTEIIMLSGIYALMVIGQSLAFVFYTIVHYKLNLRSLERGLLASVVAAFVGAATAYVMLQLLVFLDTETFFGIFTQGFVAGLCGLAGVFIGYWLMRSPELQEIIAAYNRRRLKPEVVSPEQEIL